MVGTKCWPEAECCGERARPFTNTRTPRQPRRSKHGKEKKEFTVRESLNTTLIEPYEAKNKDKANQRVRERKIQ